MKYLKALFAFIVICIVFYGIWCFINAGFDVRLWPENERQGAATAMLLIGGFVSVVVFFDNIKK